MTLYTRTCSKPKRPAWRPLVTEHIEFAPATSSTSELLGQQLAQMHRSQAPQYGWDRDNTIGATPQHNAWTDDWIDFLREKRLGFQLELAAANHAPVGLLDRGARLLEHLEEFFAGSPPAACLLHGDLWGGNWGADEAAQPVIFDPAVYFGDREADIAMTELFGGFDQRFYAAYNASWPLDPGYDCRKRLYNLYHVLNHFNLFGGGYAGQAGAMVDRLLAELSG
jgi:fructosamine-3-kinase